MDSSRPGSSPCNSLVTIPFSKGSKPRSPALQADSSHLSHQGSFWDVLGETTNCPTYQQSGCLKTEEPTPTSEHAPKQPRPPEGQDPAPPPSGQALVPPTRKPPDQPYQRTDTGQTLPQGQPGPDLAHQQDGATVGTLQTPYQLCQEPVPSNSLK